MFLAALLCLIFVGVPASFAQKKPRPLAGGYAPISAGSQEVVDAARFAAREQRDLTFVESIQSAERQVVAALNYRISMRVWDGSIKLRNVKAVVHTNTKGEYSLTSWEVVSGPAPDAGGLPSIYADSPIEQLMKAIDDAYRTDSLGRLDARRPYLGQVRIVIEHSLAGDGEKNQFVRRSFRTLAQAESWLRKRKREDGTPFRETRPLYECASGVCEFDFNGGILHNHLYLKRVYYGWRGGRPYIKTIYLLDGD